MLGFGISIPGQLIMEGIFTAHMYQKTTNFLLKSSTDQQILLQPNRDINPCVMHFRVISYLFHWHKEKLIFKDISHEKFSKEFTDYLLLGLLRELEECLRVYGELGCLYQTTGRDGVLKVIYSPYTTLQEEKIHRT